MCFWFMNIRKKLGGDVWHVFDKIIHKIYHHNIKINSSRIGKQHWNKTKQKNQRDSSESKTRLRMTTKITNEMKKKSAPKKRECEEKKTKLFEHGQ